MAVFSYLQNEVKRRATKNQGGTQFDTAIKNSINASIKTIARYAKWRSLRRESFFETIAPYSTGSGAGTFTNDSKNVTVTGATFLTDNVRVGRFIKLSGSGVYNRIKTITGETTLTLEKAYNGTTTNTGTYEILGQCKYNLPVQSNHEMFLWHEEYGYPVPIYYIPEMRFYYNSVQPYETGVPEAYHMWGEDMVIEQLLEPSVVTISSSSTADTRLGVTIFGIVNGYPDNEVVTTNGTNGTTAANGSKTFSSIERIAFSSNNTGRITVTANSANTTVAVIPVGGITSGIKYSKIELYPLPTANYEIKVYYYKKPYNLINDNDIHELGEDFDEAIILLSTSKINGETGKLESDKFYSFWISEMRSLKSSNVDKIDWFPELDRPYELNSGNVHKYLKYKQMGSGFGRKVF